MQRISTQLGLKTQLTREVSHAALLRSDIEHSGVALTHCRAQTSLNVRPGGTGHRTGRGFEAQSPKASAPVIGADAFALADPS
jgi:hypothetical protein